MLKENNVDAFLDAFLDGKRNTDTDIDFWNDPQQSRQDGRADLWDGGTAAAVPYHKGRLSIRSRLSIFCVLFLIPVTIWLGVHYLNDRKYLLISLAIAVFSMLPFFIAFEDRKPQARELVIIAVQAALAVAGRAVLFMLPSCKPVAAIVIVTAVSFGPESGFLVGAISMLASNMMFGQGPWTPWQMFAMGLIGLAAGVLFQKGWMKADKKTLCVFGFLAAVFLYGGIMNPASLVMMSYKINQHNLLAIYISGLPVDLTHGAATALFLFFGGRPMIEKLERIKRKYGLIEN